MTKLTFSRSKDSLKKIKFKHFLKTQKTKREMEQELESAKSTLELLKDKIKPRKNLKTMALKLTDKGLHLLEEYKILLLNAKQESYSTQQDDLFMAYIWLIDNKTIHASVIYNLLGTELLDINTAGHCPKKIVLSRLSQTIIDIQKKAEAETKTIQWTDTKLGKRMKHNWDAYDCELVSIDESYKEAKIDITPNVSVKTIKKIIDKTPSNLKYSAALQEILKRDKLIKELNKTKQEIEAILDELMSKSENPSSFSEFKPNISDPDLKKKILFIAEKIRSLDQEACQKTNMLTNISSENIQLKANWHKKEQSNDSSREAQIVQLKLENEEIKNKLQINENRIQTLCQNSIDTGVWIKDNFKEEKEKMSCFIDNITSKELDASQKCWDCVQTISLTIFEKAKMLQEINDKWQKEYDSIKGQFNQSNERLMKIEDLLTDSEKYNLPEEEIWKYLRNKASSSLYCSFFYPDWDEVTLRSSERIYSLVPFSDNKKKWSLLVYSKKGDHHLITLANYTDGEADNIVSQHFRNKQVGHVNKESIGLKSTEQIEKNNEKIAILIIARCVEEFLSHPIEDAFQRIREKAYFTQPVGKQKKISTPNEFLDATNFRIFCKSAFSILKGETLILTH
jgi:hypothetical protein